jgi:mannose-6-phosphate isomerase-like protein (cupin superfamily)
MSDYTKKNLREVKDSAPKFGFSDVQEAHFAREELDSETAGLSYHAVRAGRRQGFGHRHEQAEEVYVIVAGSGRMKLDDDVIDVGPLDAVRVAPKVARAFEAGPGEDLQLLAFGPYHKGDGDLLMDFWPEDG